MRVNKRRVANTTTVVVATGLLAASLASTAQAAATGSSGTPYGGFTTSATAVPLRIEVYEPAIPLPSSPQLDMSLAYTNVSGSSGPASTARSSAFWPGATLGEGLPTILGTLGLPANLFGGQYPVQANAQFPGSPNTASQSYAPGVIETASGSATEAVARAGWSPSGHVAGDQSSSGLSSVLSGLQSGSLGGLTGLLGGSTSSSGSNPLGALSLLISVSGMSSSSSTDYGDRTTVSATAASQVGEIDLLGGLVKLEGITVTSTSSSSLSAGGTSHASVVYGGITIAGQVFKLTDNGVQAGASNAPIPGLPSNPTQALARLGISITMPKPSQTGSGAQTSSVAQGPTLTVDSQPLISMLNLNTSPLSSLINQLPSSAGQVKSTLLGLLQAHPQIVVLLGDSASSATTIAPIKLGGGSTPPAQPVSGSNSAGFGGSVPVPPTTTPPVVTSPPVSARIKATSAPGLPGLGGLPGILLLAGLALTAGAAWLFRAMALNALGGTGSCAHGLVSGIPDLRKA